MAQQKKKNQADPSGRMSVANMRKMLNKAAGHQVCFDLSEENPTEVPYWIPTTATWLDCIVAQGMKAGIPGGKVSEIAGLEGCVTEDTIVEIIVEKSIKVKISEIEKLLQKGKKIKIRTVGDEFVPVTKYIDKGILPTFEVSLQNGLIVQVSLEHKFFTNLGWLETRNLIPEKTKIFCEDGNYSLVESIVSVGTKRIVDITVDHPDHCYFGNGMLHHNSGKSYMAAQIAANALDMGLDVVYFDTESAIDPSFWSRIGIGLDEILYVQPPDIEYVLEEIDELIANNKNKTLFIIDSLANAACRTEHEGDFNPNSTVAVKPRVLSKGFRKLTLPLAQGQHTLLVLNQLKTNIAKTPAQALVEPYIAPGGKAATYAYSLRIWLTKRKAKAGFVLDDNGFTVGSEVKCTIKKSRFGTERRQCTFKILWGGENVSIQDEESWFDAIEGSSRVSKTGNRYCIDEGEPFKRKNLPEMVKKDPAFKKLVLDVLEEHLIHNFDNKTGNAAAYYDVDDEEGEQNEQ